MTSLGIRTLICKMGIVTASTIESYLKVKAGYYMQSTSHSAWHTVSFNKACGTLRKYGQAWCGGKLEGTRGEGQSLRRWHWVQKEGVGEVRTEPGGRHNVVRSVLVLPPFLTRGKWDSDSKHLVQGFAAKSGRWRLSDFVYSLMFHVCALPGFVHSSP